MTSHRTRASHPRVQTCEPRLLLAGGVVSAQWIGQDGRDLVGPSSLLGGDDVQDIHVSVTGLRRERRSSRPPSRGLAAASGDLPAGPGAWAAAIERPAGSTTAELYVEPSQTETGRPFELLLNYDDGSSSDVWFQGGSADPNLRTASSRAQLAWIGQDGHDEVGVGPAVGPDGIQDMHFTLANLSATTPISGVTITSSSGSAWAFGTNPSGLANASLVRNGTSADLYLNPYGDPSGQTFTATITYANTKTDTASVLVGHADPNLAQPLTAGPLPSCARWVHGELARPGWPGSLGPGSARIAVSGLPAGRTVVAAALSDPSRSLWVYQARSERQFLFRPLGRPPGFPPVGDSGRSGVPPGS